ncbi:hypothetical protein GCM10010492_70030 [Saccharothrix mutabilis subsp. mutabilis]|uniref:Uncharacterized protein n=1 Tax=Saccharothrix mutabilis subsp. mutabilis TaxID=66855 RepID=A0ABP3ED07_9PSEU
MASDKLPPGTGRGARPGTSGGMIRSLTATTPHGVHLPCKRLEPPDHMMRSGAGTAMMHGGRFPTFKCPRPDLCTIHPSIPATPRLTTAELLSLNLSRLPADAGKRDSLMGRMSRLLNWGNVQGLTLGREVLPRPSLSRRPLFERRSD